MDNKEKVNTKGKISTKEKILKGLELSSERLIVEKREKKQEVVVMQNGKIVWFIP